MVPRLVMNTFSASEPSLSMFTAEPLRPIMVPSAAL